MMNGIYGGMGGGWMIIGVLVCIAIIGAVVWLVMRSLNSRQTTPLSQQPHSSQMNGQGYQQPLQQGEGTYQEGGMPHSYAQPEREQAPMQYPPQERLPS